LNSGSNDRGRGLGVAGVLRSADPHNSQPVGDARLHAERAGDLGEATPAGEEQAPVIGPHRLGDDRVRRRRADRLLRAGQRFVRAADDQVVGIKSHDGEELADLRAAVGSCRCGSLRIRSGMRP
jgi:hypothetical protein